MKRLIFFAKHMEIGGLEKSLLNLLNRLVAEEYQVDLVLEELHGPLLEQLDNRISVSEYRLSQCGFVPLRKLINLTKRLLWSLKHRNKYDFSCSYCTYSVIGSRLAQYASQNSCLYVHNDYTTIYPDPAEFKQFFSELQIEQFRNILFVSNESKQHFVELLPAVSSHCDVVNNVVEWEHIRQLATQPCPLYRRPGETLFVFVGRLDEPHKRISRLLKAFQLARESRQGMRLLIVGDGPDRTQYEELVAQYGLSDCVDMVGAQTNPYPYLNQSDCLVLSSDYEGFPVVYFEAMILGKDIITTIPVSDERVDVGAYATVVDKTPESLAKALTQYQPRNNIPLNMEELNQKRIEKLKQIIEHII